MTYQTYAYSDLGNAKRWANLFGERFKWIPELKTWFRWNGSRWEEDIAGFHIRQIDRILAELDNELAVLTAQFKEAKARNSDEDAKFIKEYIDENRKWHRTTQSAGKIEAMVKLARSQPEVSKSYKEFDSKGQFLGVKNGVLNLETGKFVSDLPKYFITKSCNADYQPEAQCPNWIKFLNRIFEGSQEKIQFIQRLFGQGLLGKSEKSKLTLFCGNGANGKSTLVDTIISLMGDYARNTSATTITEGRANKEYYLADLKGVRLSIINESKKGAYLDEELVKSLVDSGNIQARPIYGSPISFQPVATPILTTNYRPRISADYSISRRLIYVPFDYQLPVEERNPKFRAQVLEPELSGILNWVLEGCREYQKQGLNPPMSIIEATESYIQDNDRIGRFLDEYCVESPTDRVGLQEIKTKYIHWSQDNGYREVSSDRISQDIRAKGYKVEKRNNGYFYVLGLRFKTKQDELKAPTSIVPFKPIDPKLPLTF